MHVNKYCSGVSTYFTLEMLHKTMKRILINIQSSYVSRKPRSSRTYASHLASLSVSFDGVGHQYHSAMATPSTVSLKTLHFGSVCHQYKTAQWLHRLQSASKLFILAALVISIPQRNGYTIYSQPQNYLFWQRWSSVYHSPMATPSTVSLKTISSLTVNLLH